jgi:hypothetical protein
MQTNLNAETFASLRTAITDLAPPSRIRANDTDREAAAERIRRAFIEGRLALDEFDSRTAAAWAATTRADLETLTADLPMNRPVAGAAPVLVRGTGNIGLKVLRVFTALWLVSSLVNVAIWALVCVTTVSWHYPWWLWVAVPQGAVIVALSWYFNPRHK